LNVAVLVPIVKTRVSQKLKLITDFIRKTSLVIPAEKGLSPTKCTLNVSDQNLADNATMHESKSLSTK